jgi:hypothetical protein
VKRLFTDIKELKNVKKVQKHSYFIILWIETIDYRLHQDLGAIGIMGITSGTVVPLIFTKILRYFALVVNFEVVGQPTA